MCAYDRKLWRGVATFQRHQCGRCFRGDRRGHRVRLSVVLRVSAGLCGRRHQLADDAASVLDPHLAHRTAIQAPLLHVEIVNTGTVEAISQSIKYL